MNIEYLNSAACLLMMCYLMVVAAIMPARGAWAKRLGVWLLAVMLVMQVLAPMVDWLPPVSWYTAILHLALAGLLLAWRREALALVRFKFAHPAAAAHGRRRSSDWGELAQ